MSMYVIECNAMRVWLGVGGFDGRGVVVERWLLLMLKRARNVLWD